MVGGAVGIESLSHWAFEFLASTVSHSISQKKHSLYFLVTTFLDESECFLPRDIGQFYLLCDSNIQTTSSHDLQSHFLPHFTPLSPHAAKFSLKWQTKLEQKKKREKKLHIFWRKCVVFNSVAMQLLGSSWLFRSLLYGLCLWNYCPEFYGIFSTVFFFHPPSEMN